MLEPPEGFAMDDPIPVTLESCPESVRLLMPDSALRLGAQAGHIGEIFFLQLFQFISYAFQSFSLVILSLISVPKPKPLLDQQKSISVHFQGIIG